eukprot:189281-Amphidinium_carterae.1
MDCPEYGARQQISGLLATFALDFGKKVSAELSLLPVLEAYMRVKMSCTGTWKSCARQNLVS